MGKTCEGTVKKALSPFFFFTSLLSCFFIRCNWQATVAYFKVVANEDTLWRTRCSWCFLGRANGETFVADTKCFWKKSETFLCLGHKFCVCNKGNICVRHNVSATLCPRLPPPIHFNRIIENYYNISIHFWFSVSYQALRSRRAFQRLASREDCVIFGTRRIGCKFPGNFSFTLGL